MSNDRAVSLADFDRHVAEHGIAEKELPEAFAQWHANATGKPITGEPVGEGTTVRAEPEKGQRTLELLGRRGGYSAMRPATAATNWSLTSGSSGVAMSVVVTSAVASPLRSCTTST